MTFQYLRATSFKVQAEALKRAENRTGYNWYLEQGLGKTMVALEDFLRWRATGRVELLVVVCPNSLKENWRAESEKWGAGLTWAIWQGDPRIDMSKADAFAINYEAVLSSGGDLLLDLLKNNATYLLFDESHRIKNPSSKITLRMLGDYAKKAVVKRCLTGTPQTNTVLDWWTQIRMTGALEGSNPISFRNRFCTTGGFKGRQITGAKNEDALRRLIAESGFRATKEEWASDLPPKLYAEPIKVSLPPVLLKHYQMMQEEFIVLIDPDTIVAAEMVASQYIKLQQISSGFIKENDTYHQLVPTEKLEKFQGLCDVLEANGIGGTQLGSKTLVFAHFRHTCAELIRALTEKYGEDQVCWILGGQKDTSEHKDRFNATGGPQIMVLQLAAGKEGHTLLGGPGNPCHTIVYYENNFNLGDRLQSEDRAHRYGQVNPVLYKDFVSSPIEALVIAAFQKKKELVGYLLDNKERLTNPE